ncbi:MAG: hypothetical protein PVI57_11135 [Gemmatimonadota bacterium]|jgi:hypothetical protein
MRQLERLGLPAWCLALILVLFPVLDLAQGFWPFQPGEVAWRFGAASLLSRAVVTPLIGLTLAYAAAVLLDQSRVLKVLAVLNGVLAVVLLGGVAVYVLDAIQMRARVAPDALRQFDVGSGVVLVKFGLGFVVLLVLLVSEWRTASGLARRRRASRAETSAVLVQPARRRSSASGADGGEPLEAVQPGPVTEGGDAAPGSTDDPARADAEEDTEKETG